MAQRNSILITGAASGIGRAAAVLFARHGWFVGCLDRDATGLLSLQDELGGDNVLCAEADVSDPAALHAVVDQFGKRSGATLNLLFSNAGIDPLKARNDRIAGRLA